MGAPRKYPDELRERATRMALDARQDPAARTGALKRIGDQLGVHPEALRTWVKQAEIDGGRRPGVSSDDATRIVELERENRELRRAFARSSSATRRRSARTSSASTGSFPADRAGGRSARSASSIQFRNVAGLTSSSLPTSLRDVSFDSSASWSRRRSTYRRTARARVSSSNFRDAGTDPVSLLDQSLAPTQDGSPPPRPLGGRDRLRQGHRAGQLLPGLLATNPDRTPTAGDDELTNEDHLHEATSVLLGARRIRAKGRAAVAGW
jgi:transposase